MSRLPSPGGDIGEWGTILNDYLAQAHTEEGLLKDGSVGANTISNNAITTSKISDGAVTDSKLAQAVKDNIAAGAIVVIKNNDNTWPARPANAQHVLWVGVGSPDPSPSVSNDIWIDTTV